MSSIMASLSQSGIMYRQWQEELICTIRASVIGLLWSIIGREQSFESVLLVTIMEVTSH